METVAKALEAALAYPSHKPFLHLFGRVPVELEQIRGQATRFRAMLSDHGLAAGDLILLKFPADAWDLFIPAYLGAHLGRVVPVLASAAGGTEQWEAAVRDLPVRAAAEPSGHGDFRLKLFQAQRERAPEEIAEYLLTSGTTGRPKVVPVTHAARLVGKRGLASSGTIAISIPPGTNAAQTVLAEAVLGRGGLACLERWSPSDFLVLAEEAQAKAALLAPAMAASLLREPGLAQGRLQNLRSLRLGMAPASRGLVDSLAAALPGVTITNVYTTTEAWPAGTVMRHSRDDPASVGKPLPGTLVRVIDGATGKDALPVQQGRIQLAYAPDATQCPNWIETGDYGYLGADGSLVLLGRESEIVTRGGVVVSLAEVERTILGSGLALDAGAYSVATARGEELIGAAVVWHGQADEVKLRQLIREKMGGDAVPAIIETVPEIPRDPQGKLRRSQLRPAEAAVPIAGDPILGELRRIWAEIFMRENFGAEEDFFQIGGDSLTAILCNTLIAEQFGIRLPLSLHYSATTLEELAGAVRSRIGEQ
jgi:acyl-coenzyme A synthetase/AMP-(fatty) acid ligase